MYRSIVLSLFPVRPSRLSSQNRKQSIQSEHCSRMGGEGSLPKSNLTETDSSVAFETRAVKVTVNLSVAICLIWWDRIKFDWSFHYFKRVRNVWPETWLFQHSYRTLEKRSFGNIQKKLQLSPKCNQLCFLLHRNKSHNLAARSKSICIDCRCLAIVSSVNKYWCNHFLPTRPLHPGWA